MSEVRLLSLGNLRPYMNGDQSSFTLAEPFINSFLKIYLGREVMFGDIMSAETLFAITRCSYSNFKEKLVSRTRPNLEIALNTQKRPYLNQASKNYTCQRFLTKKFLETNWISNPKYPSIIPFTWVPPPPLPRESCRGFLACCQILRGTKLSLNIRYWIFHRLVATFTPTKVTEVSPKLSLFFCAFRIAQRRAMDQMPCWVWAIKIRPAKNAVKISLLSREHTYGEWTFCAYFKQDWSSCDSLKGVLTRRNKNWIRRNISWLF